MVCDRSVTVFERSWVKAVGECKCVKVTRILKQAINILFDKIKQRSLSNKAAGTAAEYIRLLSVCQATQFLFITECKGPVQDLCYFWSDGLQKSVHFGSLKH